MRVADLESIKIKLASSEDILAWSHGEVTKPETINYRTQKPEKDGLFCEKIFGPTKDYECYCGKYRRIRYKGVICDKCGVEVTKAQVRRERMGHIKLATPCSHIWFLRGVPSRIGMILDVPMQQLEKVIYFAAYIITEVREKEREKILADIGKEYQQKVKVQSSKFKVQKLKAKSKKELKTALEELKTARDRARSELLSLQPLQVLSEVDYHNLSLKYGEAFKAGTGAEALDKIFKDINLKEKIEELKKKAELVSPIERRRILRRARLFQGMMNSGIKPDWVFLTVLPVLPPDLRPMVQLDGGRYASSDLNDLYRRVINRNNRLKYLLEISAPEVIVRNEKRMLQEAVDALIDNTMRKGQTTTATTGGKRLLKSLADMLKGKQGRFRQNLLGKRVDYSGRSVIVVGPELKLSQCGLPKKMALELFKPFVIQKLLEKELAYNVRGASRLIDEGIPEVWENLEEIVKDKFVLLNRAPTLHRLGIQAFRPVLIEGEAIRLHPLTCKAFNADFDGDQMAVHVPLSEEAQKEAREIMRSDHNLLKPATGFPIVAPSQDITLGCYWLTEIKPQTKGEGKIFSSRKEAILARELGVVDLRAKIKIRDLETTTGRILFNELLPQGFEYVNETINAKRLEEIVSQILEREEPEKTTQYLDKIKELGFEMATISGITWGMDDLKVPQEKEKIIKTAEKEVETVEKYFKKGLLSLEEKRAQVIGVWQKVKTEVEKLVPKTLLGSPVYTIIASGSRGSWVQPVQMAGMKGLVVNPAGQIIELPVKSSFKEGFDILEYFISTHGARKGTADTALRTSTAGYLTRRLIDVAHEVIIAEDDCKDVQGITILRSDAEAIGQSLSYKITGRVNLEELKVSGKVIVKKGEIINLKTAKLIEKSDIQELRVRSVLTCKTDRGVCAKCYGWDLGNNKLAKLGEAVGIVAAQSIGEPGTQLTMRTFHTGGVAGEGDITLGLPRVQEVFEARVPLRKAIISEVQGKIAEITKDRVIKIKSEEKGSKKKEMVLYQILLKSAILVKVGDKVNRGQQLCEGNVDLQELFKLTSLGETQNYIIKEIQKIYLSQGVAIHDKHIEAIARQMFSRVRIKDSGDSYFVPGEIREKVEVIEENQRLKNAGKKPVQFASVLLGISRVALTTESFLSAASFQETSRILIRAALEGREDKLRGLKENVIIGKLIPAGTGFKKSD